MCVLFLFIYLFFFGGGGGGGLEMAIISEYKAIK